MYYVYVLQSLKKKTYYKGRTENLERRLKEHQQGKTSSNRSMKPFRLIHVELCNNINDAMKMEKFLKSGFGREIIQEIDALVAELVYAIA